jgi:hypothetical protein
MLLLLLAGVQPLMLTWQVQRQRFVLQWGQQTCRALSSA